MESGQQGEKLTSVSVESKEEKNNLLLFSMFSRHTSIYDSTIKHSANEMAKSYQARLRIRGRNHLPLNNLFKVGVCPDICTNGIKVALSGGGGEVVGVLITINIKNMSNMTPIYIIMVSFTFFSSG